jgi:hypothetical protein
METPPSADSHRFARILTGKGLRRERHRLDSTGPTLRRAAPGDGPVRGDGRLHFDSERLGEESTFALIPPIYDDGLRSEGARRVGQGFHPRRHHAALRRAGGARGGAAAGLSRGALIHERLAAAAPAIEATYGFRPQRRIGINSGLAVVTQIRRECAAMSALGDRAIRGAL